jgi:hypothetical protein
MECYFEHQPVKKFRENYADWFCLIDNNSVCSDSCYSFIKAGGNIIQVDPTLEFVRGFGTYENFEVENYLVHATIDLDNILPKTDFTFGVKCGDCVFEEELTPTYNLDIPYKSVETALWSKDNAMVIGFIIILIIIFGVTWRLISWFRK